VDYLAQRKAGNYFPTINSACLGMTGPKARLRASRRNSIPVMRSVAFWMKCTDVSAKRDISDEK